MQLPLDLPPLAQTDPEKIMTADPVAEETETQRILREQRPSPVLPFQRVGRNARLRAKLAQADQILANETGWLSGVCRSRFDGAVSGFLDAVRVQSRGLQQPSGSSRHPTISTTTTPHSSTRTAPDGRHYDRKTREYGPPYRLVKYNRGG